MSHSSQSSNMLNQARLKVLKAREDHVSSVMDDAKTQLVKITKDQNRYGQILQGLVAQGVCQLLEGQITVRCRQADKAQVEAAVGPAVESVKGKIKRECQVKVDQENFLSQDW